MFNIHVGFFSHVQHWALGIVGDPLYRGKTLSFFILKLAHLFKL
jgi:hypothetical protein